MENEIIKENSRNKSSRNSGIDFLRAIAILLIIMSHSVPFYGDSSHPSFINLRMETTNIQILVLIAFVYFGQIGNSIFVIISSYYLLESSKVKKDKVLNIVIDTILFSLLFMILLLVCGYDIGLKNIIKSFFPITFANNWFIGCYLLLYLIHPYLNIIIEGISRKELLGINVVGIFLYSIISFFLGGGVLLLHTSCRICGYLFYGCIYKEMEKHITCLAENFYFFGGFIYIKFDYIKYCCFKLSIFEWANAKMVIAS